MPKVKNRSIYPIKPLPLSTDTIFGTDEETGNNANFEIGSLGEVGIGNEIININRIISGNVVWTGNGLAFQSVWLTYELQAQIRQTHGDTITLDVSDATYDRFDLIIVDVDGLNKITGTAGVNPSVPSHDSDTQVAVIPVLVKATATLPDGITLTDVYKENLQESGGEWDTSETTSGVRFDLDNTTSPLYETKDIKTSTALGGDKILFETSTPISLIDFNHIWLKVKCLGYWNRDVIMVTLKNNGNTVATDFIAHGLLDTRDATIIQEAFPFVGGGVTTPTLEVEFNQIEFEIVNSFIKGTSTTEPTNVDFQIDNILIQSGGENSPITTEIYAKDVITDTTEFGKNIPTTDDNVQKALQTINDLDIGDNTVQNINRIISGGVIWTGTGLVYQAVHLKYELNSQLYEIHGDQVTLTVADVTNDRFDVIVADAEGLNQVTGTPSGTPAVPSIDLDTQISTNIVLVKANATTPDGVVITTVYEENLQESGGEYDTAVTAETTGFDLANTTLPLYGTKDIKTLDVYSGDKISFTNTTPILIADFNHIEFNFKSLAYWGYDKILVKLYKSSTLVGRAVIDGSSLDTTDTYPIQGVYLFKSAFTIRTGSIIDFDKIELEVSASFIKKAKALPLSANVDFQLDNIYIQSGDTSSGGTGGVIYAKDVVTDTDDFGGNISTEADDVQKALKEINDMSLGGDYSEWATYTGTRVGGDLTVTLGDYDDSGAGFKIEIDDARDGIVMLYGANELMKLNGLTVQINTPLYLNTNSSGYHARITTNLLTVAKDFAFPNASGTIALESYIDDKINTTGYTVATLPTGVTGARTHVTDATVTTFYSTVVGGGTNIVPVFYNGTNWVIA